uniref:Uncharacterized protein n=1 Tax=Arundo donax TaxID=35708 RepID=A0A0A9DQB7_ARUDO
MKEEILYSKGASQHHTLIPKEFWSLHAVSCPCIQTEPEACVVCNKRLPCVLDISREARNLS